MNLILPQFNILQGITSIVDKIKEFWQGVTGWFNDLPIIELWEDIFPSDITQVIQMFIVLMILLAIFGIIRKVTVIFG